MTANTLIGLCAKCFGRKGILLPHPVDIHVGKRIRARRWLTGKTQAELAECVGIRFQQIQKYETGANRVSASRLWDIAGALDIRVEYFFEGLNGPDVSADDGETNPDMLQEKEALQLISAYYGIPKKQRAELLSLAKSLAG